MTEGRLDWSVISATRTGVAVTIAATESSGPTIVRSGSANDVGSGPSCPVTPAAATPATNAGRIGGIRGSMDRWLNRYATTALPTIAGTSQEMLSPFAEVLIDEKIRTTNGITAPAISPWTIGAGIHAAIRPVRPNAAATSTITPATIDAPTSSGKLIS